jgi:hypothetical protein
MLSLAKVFRLLTEFIFVLLGLLLVWVATTGRHFFDRRAPAWMGLGALLILWGLGTLWRAGRSGLRADNLVRGASLALMGAMILGMAWLPFAWVAPLLGVAGGVMVLRGLVSAVLVGRAAG